MAPVDSLDHQVLRAANVNPATGLATDYLNHYNEVAMMIGMIGNAPEMREPVLDWRPVDYAAHFRLTGFSDHRIAIAAYGRASPEVRTRFGKACREVERAVADTQDMLAAGSSRDEEAALRAAGIFSLIARVGAVINGDGEAGTASPPPAQAGIDALFG